MKRLWATNPHGTFYPLGERKRGTMPDAPYGTASVKFPCATGRPGRNKNTAGTHFRRFCGATKNPNNQQSFFSDFRNAYGHGRGRCVDSLVSHGGSLAPRGTATPRHPLFSGSLFDGRGEDTTPFSRTSVRG